MSNTNNSINRSSTEEFSLSAVLWRAGWSPTGLLSFRCGSQPLPLTLVKLVESDGTTVINVPGEASVRCGGLSLDSFEVTHASLAPASVVRSQCILKSSDHAIHDPEILVTPARAEIVIERDPNQLNNNVMMVVESSSSPRSTVSTGSHDLALSSSSPSSPDHSSHYATRKILKRSSSNDAMLELMSIPSTSPATGAADGGWFGGSAPTVDDAKIRIRTRLWEEVRSVEQQQSRRSSQASADAAAAVAAAATASKGHSRGSVQRGRSLGTFCVSRTWRQWRRATALIRELHPEIVMPPLELLRDVTSASGSSSRSSNGLLFSSHQRLECFFDFARAAVASLQRCSSTAAKCPVVVTLLFEEDAAAFEKFLTDAEAQHKLQLDEHAQNATPRHMIPTLPEFDDVHVRRAAPPGIVIAATAQEKQRLEKEQAPGFFSKLFASSSQQAVDVVVPLSASEVAQAKQRVATASHIFQDVREELVRWENKFTLHAALDNAAHDAWLHMENLSDGLRDFVDTLVESGDEIVNLPCPFDTANTASIIKHNRTPGSTTVTTTTTTTTTARESSSSNKVKKTMKQRHQDGTNEDDKATLLNSDAKKQQSSNSSSSNNSHITAEYDHCGEDADDDHDNDDDDCDGDVSAEAAQIDNSESEAKSALRYAIMMATSRTDALNGAQAMLAGICSATRAARLFAQVAVLYLRHHSQIVGNIKLYAALPSIGEQLLDTIIHNIRPVSLVELECIEQEILSRMHTATVLVFSLSRQLCDSVLRAEAALHQSTLEDALAKTLNCSVSSLERERFSPAKIQHSSPPSSAAVTMRAASAAAGEQQQQQGDGAQISNQS